MLLTSADDQPRRRNARSLDLDASATRAAAWVWYLHDSAKPAVAATEGRFLSSQSRRRSGGGGSSSSADRRSSRFRQEAAGAAPPAAAAAAKRGGAVHLETPMWDCGSNLYDTFELVAFGNRLDRSLMEVLPIAAAAPSPLPPLQAHGIADEHQGASPWHEPGRTVRRTLSLPRRSGGCGRGGEPAGGRGDSAAIKDERSSVLRSKELSFSADENPVRKRWAGMGKLLKAFKRVVDLRKQAGMGAGCRQSIDIVEPMQRPKESPAGSSVRGINDELTAANPRKIRSSRSEGGDCSGSDDLDVSKERKKAIKLRRRKSLDDGQLMRGSKVSLSSELGFQKSRLPISEVSEVVEGWSSRWSSAAAVQGGAERSDTSHKHLHHHYHHHHHHHLHRSWASESARRSPDTMSRLCAEHSWITS